MRAKTVTCTIRWQLLVPILIAAGVTSGCIGGRTDREYLVSTGGDARRGREVIVQFRCGACHTIPGIGAANGVFGPPLNRFGRRTFIAGNYPNATENLVNWIMSPQSMKPQTAMPNVGLSEQQARDVAAYLYDLR